MRNHIHFIAVPMEFDSMARASNTPEGKGINGRCPYFSEGKAINGRCPYFYYFYLYPYFYLFLKCLDIKHFYTYYIRVFRVEGSSCRRN